MAGFIAKQPNGLYCRFSTVVGCPTDWNMTEDDYIELCKKRAEEEAREVLKNRLYPFEMVKDYFHEGEMSQEEFDAFMTECTAPTQTSERNAADDTVTQSAQNLPMGYIGCLRCGTVFDASLDHCPGCMQPQY